MNFDWSRRYGRFRLVGGMLQGIVAFRSRAVCVTRFGVFV